MATHKISFRVLIDSRLVVEEVLIDIICEDNRSVGHDFILNSGDVQTDFDYLN